MVNTRYCTDHLRHLVFGGSRVAVNAWYAPFYDLIQTALSSRIKSLSNNFTAKWASFWGLPDRGGDQCTEQLLCQSLCVPWRTAMNEYYMANWQQLRHIEVPHSVCRKTPCVLLQRWRIWRQFYQRHHDVDRLPAGAGNLSAHVPELPIIGHIPYGLVMPLSSGR